MTDLISRADAIEAVKETKPIVRSTERNWGKMIAEQHSKELVKALKALPSADAVSEDTQTEEQARFVAKETELAHIEARLENAEKRLQGACVANFVAEQLERLKDMTDEEKWEFFRKFFGMGDAVDMAIETLPIVDLTDGKTKLKAEDWVYDATPSADAVQGWTPIKNGLPKPYKDVMATVWFEDYGDDDDAFEIAFGFLNKFGKWDLRLADGSECIKGFYVQAWQPLPTTYKGGGE